MISVAIIGRGNVAFHLFNAFSNAKDVKVYQLNSRKEIDTTGIDIAIIAVSDDAINEVSKKITAKNVLVTHTSGSVSMNSLENSGRKGVFYPLQSFSKEKEVNFDKIPFCLEAETKNDLSLLEQLATSIGKKTYHINSEQRRSLHVSAVFVNNFTNHLYKIGHDICNTFNVPFEVLYPLIQETAQKITLLSPEEAQTGPAIRNDKETIQNHLNLLNEKQKELYKTLTKSIQDGYKL